MMVRSPSAIRLSAFGAVMEITCPDAELRASFLRALPSCWSPAPEATPDMCFTIAPDAATAEGAPLYRFRQNGAEIGNGLAASQVLHMLAGRMDYHLGEYARDCAFIHAAVVVHQRRALVFPGKTRAGKSTLTAALVEAGAEYLSDDVAVIDRAGQVQFLSRDISLREDMAVGFKNPALRGQPGFREGVAPVAAILFVTWQADAPSLSLRPLSRAAAVQHLMANSMNGRRAPEAVLEYCTASVRLAFCAEGTRGAARQAALNILNVKRALESDDAGSGTKERPVFHHGGRAGGGLRFRQPSDPLHQPARGEGVEPV